MVAASAAADVSVGTADSVVVTSAALVAEDANVVADFVVVAAGAEEEVLSDGPDGPGQPSPGRIMSCA